jgi:DNA-binding GntR family transcriptional regulator
MPGSEQEPHRLREIAYAAFTRKLLAREMLPGQFVTQRELVALTGMPLGAIRELIPRLEAEGLIKTVPQRGLQIAHIDIGLIRNAFQFRIFVEREAIAIYARAASADTLARLRERHERIVREAEAGGGADLAERAQAVDWGMHDEIVHSLGNAIISNAYRVNSIKIRLIRQDRIGISDDIVQSVMAEHIAVIDQLDRRDPVAAAAALTQHLNNSRTRALSV